MHRNIHSWISSAKRTQVHLFYSGQVDVRGPVELKCRWSEDWSSCSYYCGDRSVQTQEQALVDASPKGSEDMCEKLEGEKHVKPCGENITCTGNTTYTQHKNKLTLILCQSLSSLATGPRQACALRRVATKEKFSSKEAAHQRILTNPAPASQPTRP